MIRHPTLERIVEWALGRRDSSGEVDSHLATCETCREAGAWARALAAAVADGLPPAAPESLIARALAIPVEHSRSATRRAGWSVARLVEDATKLCRIVGGCG